MCANIVKWFGLASLLWGLSTPVIALAQSSNSPTTAATSPSELARMNNGTNGAADADRLFREGREAQERGDCKLALKLFLVSHRLKPGRGKLVNIAVCKRQLGRMTDALNLFKAALLQIDASDSRYKLVQQNISELEAKIPRLTLKRVPFFPRDAIVYFDGAVLSHSDLGSSMWVEPGTHEIIVRASGRLDRKYHSAINAGEVVTLEITAGRIVPLDTELADSRTHQPSDGRRRAAIAVGIIGVGVSASLGSIGAANALLTTDAESGMRTNVFLASGAVALGAGIAGFAIAHALAGPKKPSALAGLVLSPNGSGLLIRGSF